MYCHFGRAPGTGTNPVAAASEAEFLAQLCEGEPPVLARVGASWVHGTPGAAPRRLPAGPGTPALSPEFHRNDRLEPAEEIQTFVKRLKRNEKKRKERKKNKLKAVGH